MLQLTQAACVCTESHDTLAAWRRTFERDHAIRLPQFFDAHLIASVQQHVLGARFFDHDDGVAREACMEDNAVLAMLYLISNDERLFDVVRAITGCAHIGSFIGRVYRMQADAGHYDRWHSDVTDTRLIGMSVNLSEHRFAGGLFELRDAAVDDTQWSVANTNPGDAILFEISDNLRHRVSSVEGNVPRVAYAGWFQSRPDFLAVLKREEAERVEVY